MGLFPKWNLANDRNKEFPGRVRVMDRREPSMEKRQPRNEIIGND
jgi:hypothetical protein